MPRQSKGARLWLQPARRDKHGRIIEQSVGLSGTTTSSEALVSARAKLRKLSGRSLNTSSTNTEPLELGSATLLPAKSPT